MSAGSACPRCGLTYPSGRLPFCPDCLHQAELPPLRLGDDLELLEPIGQGGMGTVWKARHLRLGNEVAVKVLSERLAGDPAAMLRLQREARTLAALNHPGIVRALDLGREGDQAYLVMDLVSGRPLSSCLPLPAARAREVALAVLDALAYAHRAGVVHRDVKPSNILIEEGGRVLVTDFGLARAYGADGHGETLTTAGRVAGTFGYMAPEALAGAGPDPRMDVFSMGVVLYEMVTGTRPAGSFAPLAGPLDRIVRRALAPAPEDRYPSAAEMRADLLGLTPEDAADALPAEERQWMRAAALAQTLATAAALWAFLLSVTPRVLRSGEEQPLIMLGGPRLADGRILSPARFETWPTLAAAGLIALALAAQALLRRHWKRAGVEYARPDRPVPQSGVVLALGAAALTLYLARRILEALRDGALSPYVPLVGGLLELSVVFFVWLGVLEAWRTGRPLQREPRLWAGLALALVPPMVELARYIAAWRP